MGNAASKRRQTKPSLSKATKMTTDAHMFFESGTVANARQQGTVNSNNTAPTSKYAAFDPNVLKQCQCSGAKLYRKIDGVLDAK